MSKHEFAELMIVRRNSSSSRRTLATVGKEIERVSVVGVKNKLIAALLPTSKFIAERPELFKIDTEMQRW